MRPVEKPELKKDLQRILPTRPLSSNAGGMIHVPPPAPLGTGLAGTILESPRWDRVSETGFPLWTVVSNPSETACLCSKTLGSWMVLAKHQNLAC